jgi:hypothetical protein
MAVTPRSCQRPQTIFLLESDVDSIVDVPVESLGFAAAVLFNDRRVNYSYRRFSYVMRCHNSGTSMIHNLDIKNDPRSLFKVRSIG